jgi:high affinity Mn2+ porin
MSSARADDSEPWSIHAQSTVIEQWHGDFIAPYSGANSLSPRREDRHTATVTFFLGRSLWPGGEIDYDPEVTQGTGLSGAVGLAGFPNGEATRAGSQNPEYNTARLFLRQSFSLGRPARLPEDERLTLTLGKLSAVDLFDANTYSHDPRTQLLNWALMDNGAWDYPADTKGYTGGFTADLKLADRSVRWGIFMEPAEANGRPLDPHLTRAFGQAFEWEERYRLGGRPGALRALVYWNRAHMGSYAAALQSAGPLPPDVTLSRRYRSKAGAGLNWEQEIAAGLGVFARLGFNDGHSETWAFTEIDRTASAGLSLKGASWRRPNDTFALAVVANGLASAHRRYLAAGGYGFIVGDGALDYGTETILEANYDWKAARWLALAPDLQLALHPGYNRDRGPVAIFALRLHAEF